MSKPIKFDLAKYKISVLESTAPKYKFPLQKILELNVAIPLFVNVKLLIIPCVARDP